MRGWLVIRFKGIGCIVECKFLLHVYISNEDHNQASIRFLNLVRLATASTEVNQSGAARTEGRPNGLHFRGRYLPGSRPVLIPRPASILAGAQLRALT